MKLTTTLILITGLIAKAATYQVSLDTSAADLGAGNSIAIFDSAGNPLSFGSGFVNIGFFTALPDFATSSASDVEAQFNQFSSTTGSINGSSDLGGGNVAEGMFSASFNETVSASFDTQPIFLLIGNGNSLSNSTDLLVFDTGLTFDAPLANQPPEIESFSLSTLQTPTFGSNSFTGGEIDISNDGFATTNTAGPFDTATSYQLFALVPEPSSAALLGLGGLALVARRRR